MIIEGNCNFPHNSGTAGPIWINFFLLAPSWSGDGFRPRILDPDSGLYGKVGSTALYTKYCVTSVVGFEVAGGGEGSLIVWGWLGMPGF